MNKFYSTLAVCTAVALLSGCTQLQEATRAKAAKVSPFIEKPELLVAQKATFPFHYFYLKKDAGKFKNVYIAPVNISYLKANTNWAALDEKMAKQLGSDVDKIATYMRKAYQDEFRNKKEKSSLQVVESPDQPDTLIVETAIVSIVPTKAELVVLGTAANIFLPGIGIITGQVAKGSITTECMIRDARTKEIIAMYANTEKDQGAILNFTGMTWYTSAERNIKRSAEYTAKIFSGEDYSHIYRRLIKIVTF